MRRYLWTPLNAPDEPPAGGPPPPPVQPPAAPPPPPVQPPAAPTPAAPPPAQPVYAAPAGLPAAHRVSGALIVGIVVVVMALGGGTAAGLAVFRHPGPAPSPPLPSAPPLPPSPPANQPSPVVQPSPVEQPSPVPESSPTPQNQPSPSTGGGGTGATIDAKAVAIDLPAGWQKGTTDDNQIVMGDPTTKGVLTVLSGQLKQPTTNDQRIQSIIDAQTKANAVAKVCQGPAAATTPGTPSPKGGVELIICETTQQGAAFEDIYSFSVLTDSQGNSFLFEINLYAPQDQAKAFAAACDQALTTLRWKLLAAQ